MGPKLYYRLMSYDNLLNWRCTKKARLMTQDISNSTRQKKADAMFCSSRPATYKVSVVTTTGMFNLRLKTTPVVTTRSVVELLMSSYLTRTPM
jgi:hypothetical protein